MTGVQHKIVGTGFGVAAAIIGYKTGDANAIATLMGSMIGCWLPDIDHDKTKLGRKRKVVTDTTKSLTNIILYGGVFVGVILTLALLAGFIDYGLDVTTMVLCIAGIGFIIFIRKVISNTNMYKWATKHRGLMHTMVVPAVLYFALGASEAPLYKYSIIGLIVGYISHLFADMLTIEGCPILFPLSRNNFRFLKLRTKDKSCTVAAWVVAIGAVIVSYYFF